MLNIVLWVLQILLGSFIFYSGLLHFAVPSDLLPLQTDWMRFGQAEVRVRAGQPVALRVVNRDGYTHAFDIDEFDVHAI